MKFKYLEAFMDMTERFAQTSEATRLKVGSCLIKNGNPICFGVNGTLPGWETNCCESEGMTHNAVVHSEINCLNKLRNINESAKGATMLITHAPCKRCAHEIVAAGVDTVIYKEEYRSNDGLEWLRKNRCNVFRWSDIVATAQHNNGE